MAAAPPPSGAKESGELPQVPVAFTPIRGYFSSWVWSPYRAIIEFSSATPLWVSDQAILIWTQSRSYLSITQFSSSTECILCRPHTVLRPADVESDSDAEFGGEALHRALAR